MLGCSNGKFECAVDRQERKITANKLASSLEMVFLMSYRENAYCSLTGNLRRSLQYI